MRTRYRLRYEVTTYFYKNIWYCPKSKKWFDRDKEEPKGSYCISYQHCRKFAHALKSAYSIKDRFGNNNPKGEVWIIRYFKKKGRRVCTEFLIK